ATINVLLRRISAAQLPTRLREWGATLRTMREEGRKRHHRQAAFRGRNCTKKYCLRPSRCRRQRVFPAVGAADPGAAGAEVRSGDPAEFQWVRTPGRALPAAAVQASRFWRISWRYPSTRLRVSAAIAQLASTSTRARAAMAAAAGGFAKRSVTRAAKASAESAMAQKRPSSAASPSAPNAVETTGMPAANASSNLTLTPEPLSTGQTKTA